MVYCSKCGTKNEETAETCVKCGAKLIMPKKKDWEKRFEEGAEEFGKRAEAWGESFGKDMEDECFGIPRGGTIFGLIFGIIIIIVGVFWIAGITLEIWPLLFLIVGIMIIAGALYTLTRKR
jgi:ribosomal protein L40E